MNHYVNYGEEKRQFSLPKSWNLISAEDKPPVPGSGRPDGRNQACLGSSHWIT